MNLEKLKDAARKHEQKEDWRKAIDAYQRIIQHFESGRDDDADLTLYNRVGDLHLKLNDPGSAVAAYERAAELYAEQGFLNNAIALCGKVLRVNPGRVQVYLQLATLHARKNVVSEAKRNLIEYIERMHTLGQLDDALKRVQVFADQHGANADIRQMLVELLRAAARTTQADERLEQMATGLGGARPERAREAVAVEDDGGEPAGGPRDLIFIETGFESMRATSAPARHAPPADTPEPGELEPVEGFETIGGAEAGIEDATAPEPVAGFDVFEPVDLAPPSEAAPLAGFEPGEIDPSAAGENLPDLEPADFEPPEDATVAPLDGLVLDGSGELEDAEVAPDLDMSIEREREADALEISMDAPADAALDLDPGFGGGAGLDIDLDAGLPVAADVPDADDPFGLEGGGVRYIDDFDIGPPDVPESGEAAEALPAPLDAEPEAARMASADAFSIADIEDRILDDPENPAHHRALAELLVAEGDRERAIEEYTIAIGGAEAREDWGSALDSADALVLLDPDSIRHQQKRVELAYRSGTRDRLLAAYLGLADALVRADETQKAAAVYRRVLEHQPDHPAARAAVALMEVDTAAPEAAAPAVERQAPVAPPAVPPFAAPAAAPPPAARSTPPAAPPEGFVDLGSMVIEERGPLDPRMRVERDDPTGDEQKDFLETLEQFKKGIEANIGTEDYEAHYDLGVAFKEMGLLDEAIAEFQKALRAPNGRLRTSEALGVTFFEKKHFAIAETILRRAVDGLPGGDDEKIGLLYWLGRAAEAQGKPREARAAWERALAVDIRFMDLGERIRQLDGAERA